MIRVNDIQSVTIFLQQGGNVNSTHYNITLLYHACLLHKHDIVRLLLQYGADPNIVDDFISTSLSGVIKTGDKERVKWWRGH